MLFDRLQALFRVWDSMFFEGSKVMFRVALALLYMNQDRFIAATDLGQLFGLMRQVVVEVWDIDTLMKVAFHDIGGFPTRRILVARKSQQKAVRNELEESTQRRMQYQQ